MSDGAVTTPLTALIRYDVACQALAAARTVDDVRQIRDAAEAMRAYAKQAKNRQLELDAAEIRIRAERRVGELIAAQKASVGLARPGRPKNGSDVDPIATPATLAEAGIDKHLADRARRLAKLSEPDFAAHVATWRGRVESETERVTKHLFREGDRADKRARPIPALPAGQFRLLYADPPWRYEHVVTESRAIENQYPTMALDDICALRVPAADDAVLFLWATPPKMAEAVQVIDAWGFSYRTCASWDKEQIGMGYYFRQQHELLLVAARGALPVPDPRCGRRGIRSPSPPP